MASTDNTDKVATAPTDATYTPFPPYLARTDFAVDPGGQPAPAFTPLNQFLPYPNMQGIEMPNATEPQVPKVVVADNLLERVMRTAKDARDAFSLGRDVDGSQRVAELKAAVEVVSSFVQLHYPPPDPKRVSPPSASASRKGSLPDDPSRKRCASAQGDRVLKSLKLEPKDEAVPVVVPVSTAPPPPLLHAQTFPSGMHTLATPQPQMLESLGHANSFPGSRAESTHQVPTMQHQPHPLLPSHQRTLSRPQHSHTHSLSHQHIPSVHHIANGKPPAAPPPIQPPAALSSGWPDPAMMQAPQVIPPAHPRFDTTQSPPFHPRPNRSSSYSGSYPFAYTVANPTEDANYDPSRPSTSVSVANSSSPDLEGESDNENSPGRMHAGGRSDGGYLATHPSNDIPQDLRAEVDKIFILFLKNICSDLEATDNKGEPIHQPLMAKKMQRLDESPDFRPFKFRIQAFTNGFLEELAKQGLPEEVIPMKKVRHYLWTSPYISRFNEDGKKAKSKGNHIWNIDAKKAAEGGWTFRPFRRKIAGAFPGVAYVGLRWQFHPRVWDPQASRSNVHVRFTSPTLPSWLNWTGDVLSGTPGSDTPNTDVVIEARFTQDGKDVLLSQKYFLSVAPLSRDDPGSYMAARRPSLGSDRRGVSDSAVAQAQQSSVSRHQQPPPAAPAPYQEALTVVTEAIKAVSIEAHSVQAAPNPDPEQQIQLQTFLTRQEQVLTVTAHAINDAMFPAASGPAAHPSALARAGTDVVIKALHKVAAEHSAVLAMGLPAEFSGGMQEVTMQEVSSATKTAVAQAVEQTNTLTSPIDVMLTAENIIQRDTQGIAPPPDPSALGDYTMSESVPP